MITQKENISYQTIQSLLERISTINQVIEHLRKAGEMEDGLMIRQEKHLKKRFTTELLDLLKDFDLNLQLIEV